MRGGRWRRSTGRASPLRRTSSEPECWQVGCAEAVDPAYRGRAVEAAVASARRFVNEICRGDCPHGCGDDLSADGRALFFSEELPWLVPESEVRLRTPREPAATPDA